MNMLIRDQRKCHLLTYKTIYIPGVVLLHGHLLQPVGHHVGLLVLVVVDIVHGPTWPWPVPGSWHRTVVNIARPEHVAKPRVVATRATSS